MRVFQSGINHAINPVPHTTGSRMMHALDLLRVSSPMQVQKARANAMMFADRYGFRLPAPLNGVDSAAGFLAREGSAFVAGMRPVFDAEIGRISGGGSYRLYLTEELAHADLAAASATGLVSHDAVVRLLDGVVKNSERLLEFSSSRIPENPFLKPKFIAGRIVADVSAFGAAYALTGSALSAAAIACALAIKIEAAAFAASRLSISRQRKEIELRMEELTRIIERAREQQAPFAAAAARRGDPQEIVEIDDADIVIIEQGLSGATAR